jgi:4-aminobutyrate aminotransferase-like enzyme
MSLQERTATEKVLDARERYVAAGVSTPPLVVARAEGARIEDVDGKTYIDFAGGLGCQNTGHGLPAVVSAIHEQADRYLHQCFMVGMYEPYVEMPALRAVACRGEQRNIANSGGAVENAVKIARCDRRPRSVFDRAFHGCAPDHDDDSRSSPTARVRAVRARVCASAPIVPGCDRGRHPRARDPLQRRRSTTVRRLRRAQPVQGERLRGHAARLSPRLQELCQRHDPLRGDEVQAGGTYGAGLGDRATESSPSARVRQVARRRPLLAASGGGDRRRRPAGGLGGTFGGNPLACARRLAVLDGSRRGLPPARRRVGELIRAGLEAVRDASTPSARSRARLDAGDRTVAAVGQKAPAGDATTAARGAGSSSSCGLYGNVIRILVPLVVFDEDLDRGLELLEEALVEAGTRAA